MLVTLTHRQNGVEVVVQDADEEAAAAAFDRLTERYRGKAGYTASAKEAGEPSPADRIAQRKAIEKRLNGGK